MRMMLGTLALATAFAAPLEQGERDRAMSHLHATRKVFLDSIAGLSDAQWNFKPAADRWSIAECAEHIAVSDDSLFDLMRQTLKSPAAPEKKSAVKDEFILQVVPDRSVKPRPRNSCSPSAAGRTVKRSLRISSKVATATSLTSRPRKTICAATSWITRSSKRSTPIR